MLNKGSDLRLIDDISFGQAQLNITHLQFADDTLIFSLSND
jgi:hypothetical protein